MTAPTRPNPAERSRVPALVAAAALLAASSVSAEEPPEPPGLLWPTDAGKCVTSTFCEFRPGHFHSGIDISTWGNIGYRCLAMDDGDIVRARVSCGGYGRAVYVRLRDGRTAVYAHLSRFEGALEDSVRTLQTERGTAYFDASFEPGTFPVKRGDVVAYTGQSGVGVPHLHVEIRDEAERPLDPLRNGLVARDTSPPWVARLAITPLTPTSSVDGRGETILLDVHPEDGRDHGRIPRVIPVEGEVGISVEVDETADACRFRLAASRLELVEDGSLLHAVDYEGFSFSETGRMDRQIDPRFSYEDVGRFHHLFERDGPTLPFTRPGAAPRGRVRGDGTGEIRRALEVRAVDASGNVGNATLTLSFAAPPDVRALSARSARAGVAESTVVRLDETWEDALEVHGAVARGGRPLADVELDWSPDGGTTWLRGTRVAVDPDDSFHAFVPLGRRTPGAGGDAATIVRATVRDELGASGIPRTVALSESAPTPERSPRPEIVTMGAWIEIRIGDEFPWSAVAGGREALAPADGEPAAGDVLVRPDGRGIRIVLPTRAGVGGSRSWSGFQTTWTGLDPWGRPVPLTFEVPEPYLPGDGGTWRSADGRAEISPGPESFGEPCALSVRAAPPSVDVPAELRALGPLYFLETGHVPPGRSWSVSLAPEVEPEMPERVGIFVQQRGRLRYIGGEDAEDGARWSTESRTLLGVGLFEDTRPPVLGDPRLEVRYGRTRLLFHAEDAGSGIDCDDVEVLFEGAPIVHELDDETGDVVAYPPTGREPGAGGTFEMRATDRCGNAARRVEKVTLN